MEARPADYKSAMRRDAAKPQPNTPSPPSDGGEGRGEEVLSSSWAAPLLSPLPTPASWGEEEGKRTGRNRRGSRRFRQILRGTRCGYVPKRRKYAPKFPGDAKCGADTPIAIPTISGHSAPSIRLRLVFRSRSAGWRKRAPGWNGTSGAAHIGPRRSCRGCRLPLCGELHGRGLQCILPRSCKDRPP